jgi:hypothetical protein
LWVAFQKGQLSTDKAGIHFWKTKGQQCSRQKYQASPWLLKDQAVGKNEETSGQTLVLTPYIDLGVDIAQESRKIGAAQQFPYRSEIRIR